MSRVLLSVSNKSGIVAFARQLADRGHELISTGGTARALVDAGLRVTPVASVTGFPEMLDGRLKTLHPAIHGGILARRRRPDDLHALDERGIGLIDLVVVNLYPFAEAAARAATAFDDLLEEIDIGGPTLIRAAAKSVRDVVVVVDPADYDAVARQLEAPDGVTPELRLELARKAFAHTAEYDRLIASTLDEVAVAAGDYTRTQATGGDLASRLWLRGSRLDVLRYGENPHQPAAWYRNASDPGGFGDVEIHQGKALSFTNLLDLDAASRIVLEFDEPAAAVIKHTNPCGVAVGPTSAAAYERARDADARSAFGGIVGLNRPIDEQTASAIASTFIEAVIAPGVEPAAIPLLAAKPAMRVVTADMARFGIAGQAGYDVRSILGGLLVQERDLVQEARTPWDERSGAARVVTARSPTPAEWAGLRFAWRVCGHVKSNAVIFTTSDRTVAIGAGQMSRVDAVNVAVMKVHAESLAGSAAASDGFFPFADGVEAIGKAGATAIVQPGGSRRDEEVIAAADRLGLAMVLTGRRHFRH